MVHFTAQCKKITIFTFSAICFTIGLLLIFCWENLFHSLVYKQLSLANSDTMQYKNWIETPIDIYLETFFFNLTNSEEFANGQWTKPKLEQVGPYVYTEHHSRANVVFNENNTISFNVVRSWKEVPEKTNGSLDDSLTILHPVAVAIGSVARNKHYLIRRGLHYFLLRLKTSILQTDTVRNFMFTGIEEDLITIAQQLKIKGFDIPYDKFGWLYPRNNSVFYDGNYTMWTGGDDISKNGVVTEWNQSPVSPAYTGECGRIDGTTGEVWYPVEDAESVSIFLSDTCSKFFLDKNGTRSPNGIEGNLYVSTDKMLDNGQKYPEYACYKSDEEVGNGVRDISKCKFNAPAFISLPHFNLADPSFQEGVIGINPDPNEHIMYIVIEPTLGLPIEAHAAFQGNLKFFNVQNVSMFENVKDTMIPYIWVRVVGGVPADQATLLKIVLAVPLIGIILGYIFALGGVILFSWGVYFQFRHIRRKRIAQNIHSE